MATFSESGGILQVDLAANESLAVTSAGASYNLALTGGTFSGTNSANVTGDATASLSVLAAAFTDVKIDDSANNVSVNFADSGANTFTSSFTVTLDSTAPGFTTFAGTTAFTGSASLFLQSGGIAGSPGASISTVNGNLTLRGNMQTPGLTGNIFGLFLNDTQVRVNGTGNLTLIGKSGISTGTVSGVRLQGATVITGGTTGSALTIEGYGAASSTTRNYGVNLSGTGTITTLGGNVVITGTGGTSNTGANVGVLLEANTSILATGSGSITVTGNGGGNGSSLNTGIEMLTGTQIASVNGSVSVTGTGGGGAVGNANRGVFVAGSIKSTGSGAVNVTGTGGPSAGGDNQGVLVERSGNFSAQEIKSGSGDVTITGTAGGGGGSLGIKVNSVSGASATLSTDSPGTLRLNADSMSLVTPAAISAPSVTIAPQTSGKNMDVGSTSDTIANTLSLSQAELNTISAGRINLGDSNTANITVSANITLSQSTGVNFSASTVNFGSSTVAAGAVAQNGVGSPNIIVERSGTVLTDSGTVNFGSVTQGSTTDYVFTVRNNGFSDLTGLGITIDGPNAGEFTVFASPTAPVVGGGSTTFTVRHTANTPGSKVAALHLANNVTDARNPFDINFTASSLPTIAVESPVGTAIADGGTRNFGNTSAGNFVDVTFRISNSGAGDLTGLSLTIDGANASEFSVVGTPTAPVVPGGDTSLTVRFTPVGGIGSRSAALHIANNVPGALNPYDINLTGFLASPSPITGTKSVGPTGYYSSLTQAMTDIQVATLGGAVVLELQPNYVSSVESFPLTFSNLGTTATNTLTIRPAVGATGLSISSAAAQTVDLNGAQFVTFDGRPGGTGTAKELTIENTSTLGVAVRFINEASNNTLKFVTLRGVNTSATSGTVVFSTTTGANGNDNNTLDTCDIRDGASTPANGIYSLGTTTTTAQNNSGNTVSNSNIFNFYSSTAASSGVLLAGGSTDWTISGNSFYQTATRTAVSQTVNPILINNTTGNNFTVTGNFIGGDSPGAAVTAQKWTTTGFLPYLFQGIRLTVGSTTASSVQGNTISNIVWTVASNASTLPGVWSGIYVTAGNVNIGTVTGNTIGSGTGTGSISVTGTGSSATSFGIGSASSGTVAIANNSIGSITVNGSSIGVSASLTGISVTAGANTITGNTVGSTTTANSLNAPNSSVSTTGQQVTGILSSSSTSATITGNTVANLNNNYNSTATNGQIRGIVTSAGVNTITGNTVRNLSTTSANQNNTNSQSVYGIINISTAAGQTVSQNTVHSLANTAASAAVNVTGIYYSGPTSGTNVIARNFVHSLAVSSSSAASQLVGIYFAAGTFTTQNNMVRVGIKADGTSTAGASIIYGIVDISTAGRNFYHNTVYVGGTQTSGASASQTVQSFNTGNRTFQNNIFMNARSNSGATSRHNAVIYGGTGVNPTGLTAGGNIYFASGIGGAFGFYNGANVTTLAAWQSATGQDATSAVADPLFVNPTGDAGTVDLHLQASNPAEGQGLALAGVTDDFDGQTRSTLTPVDVGADAGNFTRSSDIFAPRFSYTNLTDTLSLSSRVLPGFATITDIAGVSDGVKSPRLYFKKSTDANVFNVPNDSTGNGWKYVLADNTSSPYGFTVDYSLLNGGAVANADTIQYFLVAQDESNNFVSSPLSAASSANPPVQNISSAPSVVNSYRVGDITAPVVSYPLLSAGTTANRVLTGWASITDNVGVSGGANAPRLYFKKSTDADVFTAPNNAAGNGWKFVTGTDAGGGSYSFTLDYALLNGGSVTIGDTMQYFVVAQDAANNLGSSPTGASASANPPVQNISVKPAAGVNSFSILGTISGTKTVGTGGDYPSLSGAGGLFAAINASVVTGDVNVNIISDLTEDGSVSLNEFASSGFPFDNYTLTIRPDSATMRTISGSAGNGLITLNGADRVTIDGRFGGSGRFLTFRNTNTGGGASTIRLQNDASNNTVRNCVVEGASTSITRGVIGFGTGSVTGNDNNLITENHVRDLSTAAGVPTNLIGSNGSSAAVSNSGNTVSNNELFNFNTNGIYITPSGNDSWTITGNNLFVVNAATSSITGIDLRGDGVNVITDNYIHDLLTTVSTSTGIFFSGTGTITIARNRITAFNVNAATTTLYGISAQGSGATLNVLNNQITLIPAASGSRTIYGINDNSVGGNVVNVFYNSIVLGGTETGTANSWPVRRTQPSTHTARNNLLLNFRTGGTGNHFAMGSGANGGSFTVSNNVYAGTGATAANFMDFNTTTTPAPMSYATWQTSTGDTNSQAGIAGSGNFTSAMFVSASTGDLHLVPGGNVLVNGTGTPIAGVTTDYDGELRSPTAPIIGADEVAITNNAPTAVILTPSSFSLAENTSTASAIELSTISIIDDAFGTNTQYLSGADASGFEIVAGKLRLKAGVGLDFETKSSYSVRVNVDDSTVGGTPDAFADFTLYITDIADAPQLVSVVVNGGDTFLNAAQRSQVTSLVVTFSVPVILSSGAFSIVNNGLQAIQVPTPLSQSQILVSGSGTTYTIRFGTGIGVDTRDSSTGLGRGNSLIDGNYLLTIDSAKVKDLANVQSLTPSNSFGDGDNEFGDRYVDNFFRMFGDSDGNGIVNSFDTGAFARSITTYNAACDFDGNGVVLNSGADRTNYLGNFNKRRRAF